MVLIVTELESDLFWKWFSRPRHTDGTRVEDYYALYLHWKEEMVGSSFPAKEEDYIVGFIDNLHWEIQFRLSGYKSMSRLIDVYYAAKFEESMLVIEETLKQIKANLDLDPNELQMHDSNNSTEAIVELEDDSHNFVMENEVECKMELTTDKSTEPNLTGLNMFSGNYHFNSRIEEVELLHKGEMVGNEKFQQSYSFKNEVAEVVYQVFDEMPDPGQTTLYSLSLLSSFAHEETDDSPPIQVYNLPLYNKLDVNIWLNKILLLIFDPGGCSRPHIHTSCGSFNCCNEQDHCWVVNVASLNNEIKQASSSEYGSEFAVMNLPPEDTIVDAAACNERSELNVQKVEAFISTIRMVGISAAVTYAIRFDGATYAITRATSEKHVMVDDAFDGMTKRMQMDVTRVHRGMISSHDNHSSFLVGNEWCSTDLNSHSKNNLVYTNLWKCENVYSLNDILLLVFDPGGCSLLCMDCRLLEYIEEHGDFHFTTNDTALEYFHCAFDGDSAGHFSKGISVLRLAMGIHSMAFSWVVFAAQFCEQRQAFIILRNSQQALFHNMDECTDVFPGLPIQRVPFDFALLPLAYTMHIHTLLGSNISAYQNAGAETTVHQHVKVQIQRLRDITGAPVVFTIVDFSGQNWVTEFLSNGNDQSAEKVLEDFGAIRMIIGSNGYDGVIVTMLQNFVWDPGQNVIFLYILEDKDVVERVGKDIVLMDTTLVIRRYDHEECAVTDASCKHVMLQVEQFAQGLDIVPLLNEKDRDMGLIYNMQRASTLLHTLTLSCKLGGSALIIHRGVVMINPSFIVVVENFVWDPGLILVYFRISTLRTRWLLRGRICHELTFYYKFYMYFEFTYLGVLTSFN